MKKLKNIISLVYGWILFITFIVVTSKEELALMFGDPEEYETYLYNKKKGK